jgi:aminoglycoside phosphotransferase family enzyme/predicted kinase
LSSVTHAGPARRAEVHAAFKSYVEVMHSRDELLAFLTDERSYGERGPIQRRETHVSNVFLTGQHAYKLLKPVDFGFLDFTTREARYQTCWNEVRLNRRLAPDVYLGVVPLTISDGRLRLGGTGTPVDWLVKMRRLPDDSTLEARVGAGTAGTGDVDRILEVLIPFLRRAATGPGISEAGTPASIRQNVLENLEVISRETGAGDLSAAQSERLRSAQLQFLSLDGELFEKRASGGWVRDGHGDLKAEHFYLNSGDRDLMTDVAVVDCIAFNDRLRHVDTLDEICFLATDLERLGRSDLSEYLLREYRSQLGDPAPDRLAAFYKSYRTSVRAKVACLRSREQSGDERGQSLSEAAKHLQAAVDVSAKFHRPLLVVFCGVSGSGKSTIAARLQEELGSRRFASDVVRKRLHGLDPLDRSNNSELYSHEATRRTYAELRRLALESLHESTTAILDATFLKSDDRNAVRELARETGTGLLFVECRCPLEVAEARIVERARRNDDPSDAGLAILRSQAKNWKSIGLAEPSDVLVVDTRDEIDRLVSQIVTRLRVL